MKTLNEILEIVCDHMGEDRYNIPRNSPAKKVYCLMADYFTNEKRYAIISALCIKDHSVATHHIKHAKLWLKKYEWFRIICDEIEYKIIS